MYNALEHAMLTQSTVASLTALKLHPWSCTRHEFQPQVLSWPEDLKSSSHMTFESFPLVITISSVHVATPEPP
jgi:hypothetical protein